MRLAGCMHLGVWVQNGRNGHCPSVWAPMEMPIQDVARGTTSSLEEFMVLNRIQGQQGSYCMANVTDHDSPQLWREVSQHVGDHRMEISGHGHDVTRAISGHSHVSILKVPVFLRLFFSDIYTTAHKEFLGN